MRHLRIDIGNEISSVRVYNDDNQLIRQYHVTHTICGYDSNMNEVVNDRGLDELLQDAMLDLEHRIIDCMKVLAR